MPQVRNMLTSSCCLSQGRALDRLHGDHKAANCAQIASVITDGDRPIANWSANTKRSANSASCRDRRMVW
jgi:hypothetical protein